MIKTKKGTDNQYYVDQINRIIVKDEESPLYSITVDSNKGKTNRMTLNADSIEAMIKFFKTIKKG